MSVTHGLFTTYDSSYLADDIKGLAMIVEPRLTVSWDLLPELEPGDSTNLDWYDAQRYDLAGANRAGWNNSDTTSLGVDDTLAVIVQIGDVLKCESEYVVVSAVSARGTGAGAISVFARGHGSSSAAAHLTGTAITIVGNAQVEGTVNIDGLSEDTIKRTNYYSLVEEMAKITVTQENQKLKDIEAKMPWERERAMVRALKKINRSVFYGLKAVGTSSTPRSAGGMEEFLNSATYGAVRVNCAGVFTETKLQQLLREISLRGGAPGLVLMSPKNKQIANGFNNSYIQTARTDREAGVIIDQYQDQNAGLVGFVSDPAMRDDAIFAINQSKTGKTWFDNDMLRFVVETNTNSRVHAETLQGQYSMLFKDISTDHGTLYGIT